MKLNFWHLIFIFNILCNAHNKKLEYFYVSIPKCGNFLLQKCLTLISNKKIKPSNNRLHLNNVQIQNLNNNFILDSHAFCNKQNLKIIKENKLKGFFIYRDPRDQIVSFIFDVYKRYNLKDLFKNNIAQFASLSFDDLFFKIINDYSLFYKMWNINFNLRPLKIGKTPKKKQNINSVFKKYDNWKSQKNIYVTTFEKLVGPQGGGDLTVQLNEISNIASHMNVKLNSSEINQISNNLFGGTFTFREGKIGSWKKYFTQRHKDAFKSVAGQLLIDLGYEKDFNW